MPSESQAAPWESPACAVSDDGYYWWSPEHQWQRLPYVNSAGRAWDGFAWRPDPRPKDEWWQGPEPPRPTYRPLLAGTAPVDPAVGASPSQGAAAAPQPSVQPQQLTSSGQPPLADASTPPLLPAPTQQWTQDQVGRYRASLGLSPDGHYWWNGATWQPNGGRVPNGATRSPNGEHWWDGQGWQPQSWQGGAPGFVSSMPRPTNGLAIASLVLGILWIYWVGSVLAVIFGHIALSQIRRRQDGGHGMAIAGVVLGYIGIGVLVLFIILAAIASSVQPGG